MAYWTHTKDPIGVFVEREVGNYFEFSENNDAIMADWPHKVWVGGTVNDWGFRYARVLKTVAYIVVDEGDLGQPVVEKWDIKQHREYANRG